MIVHTPEPDRQAAAFLQAILEAPDEDAPRLQFADWLIENGQPERGEFIQVQCELADTPAPAVKTPGNLFGLSDQEYEWANCTGGCRFDSRTRTGPLCRFHALERRERELLLGIPSRRPNWIDFTGPALWDVIPDGDSYTDHIEFRRGFVEVVTCIALDWHQHGAAIRAATPLRAVTLSDYLVTNVRGERLVGGWDVTLTIRPRELHEAFLENHPWCDLSFLATWDVGVLRVYPSDLHFLVQRRGRPVRLDVSGAGLSIPCVKGRIRVVIAAP